MSDVKVVLDGAVIAAMLRSPAGPVARHLIERGELFKQAAQAQANVKSGCLRDSIVKRLEETPEGLALRVVSDTSPCSPDHKSYSLFVHEGTPEHVIPGNPTLAFYWEHGPDGPGMYFFRSVNHPDTKPNRFFTDNLPIFAR
jgi:hypothetical protein